MLSRLLIQLAYFLKSAPRYQRTKRFFYDLMENPHSRLKSYFDVFMIYLALSSVFLLIYQVDPTLVEIDQIYEDCIVGVFIVEYVLRVWLYNDCHKIILDHYERNHYLGVPFSLLAVLRKIITKKFEYVRTPLAIIDLLAILPSYRPLRILRVLLIFRLFKLFRYFHSIKLFAEVLAIKRFELYTLAVFLGFLVFTGSTGIYLFEFRGHDGQVKNLFDAFYFSVVTLATVGYGDIAPQTTGGRIVAMTLIFSGLAVISFFTSIIVAAFSDKMQDLREHKTYTELHRYDSFVIICGFGRVGQHIAKQLKRNNEDFLVIDPSELKIEKAKHLGYLAILADASRNEVLISADINGRATAILCTTGDDVVNVYITLTSRFLNPNIRIISRANNQNNIKKLYQAGANNVIQPFEIAALAVAEYIGQPVAFEAILGIIRQEKQFVMETLAVSESSFIEGKRICDLDLAQQKLMLIGVISANPVHCKHKNSYKVKNQHFYFNPTPTFELQAGDLLVLLGRDLSIEYFNDRIQESYLKKRGKV